MTNNVEVSVNEVKKINKLEMMKGYLEMAMINLNIVQEAFNAETEAETTQYAFLAN